MIAPNMNPHNPLHVTRRTLILVALVAFAVGACDVVDIQSDTGTPAVPALSTRSVSPTSDSGASGNPTSAPTVDSGANPTLEANPTANADNSWYRLYFTDPPDQDVKSQRSTDTIVEKVVASIQAATHTIDAATYDFDLQAMADALIAAHNRGLVVRLVTDTDTMGEDVIKQIKKAGIPVVEDHRSAIMHDKFVIVDSQAVWTGSWNFSENDNYRNNNNFIGIVSPEMVANYQTEFNEMFERNEFGPKSTANTPYPQFTVNGTLIENYFAPEDGVEDKIVTALQTAQQSIDFAAFTFTSQPISQLLIDKFQAGVQVQGIYEKRQVSAGADESYNLLTQDKLPVLFDGNRYTLHDKFFVIDRQIVVTGSFNFTAAANEENDENLLIIHNPGIAEQYYQEFLKLWHKAETASGQ